ncbi:hypothetical protein DSO57_1025868 [Entomophthora muscae]|uniref:Uncharacterized protein n=1 Tax=Entomophthora muscae TaxID=34485 RepID=A0ACC2T247_9FUNG|nr:hypothetical protein DSO57_1025868 [Entomophthora muscae]
MSSTKDSLYECSLFGKLDKKSFNRLRERVIAICGEDFIEVRYHEVIIMPAVTTPLGQNRNDDVTLRCRHSYKERSQASREQNWQFFMLGTPEARQDRSIIVRPVIYAPVAGNPMKYAAVVGYKLELELAKEGFTYFYKDTVLISIYKLYKVNPDSFLFFGTLNSLF